MDNKHIFRSRARLMLLLGDELIRDAGIAVFELVKNAYDADAKTCHIYLNDIDKQTGDTSRIIIHDDGCGMDFNTVNNIWMETVPVCDQMLNQTIKGPSHAF